MTPIVLGFFVAVLVLWVIPGTVLFYYRQYLDTLNLTTPEYDEKIKTFESYKDTIVVIIGIAALALGFML
jgi:hypothetical protein